MSLVRNLITKLESSALFPHAELSACLRTSDADEIRQLFSAACKMKERVTGRSVFFRGLIEISNVCMRNCFYCGIRKDNAKVQRYSMDEDEILHAAKKALDLHLGSIVLQSGEIQSSEFTERIEKLLLRIRRETEEKLGITLSLGEQSAETYDRWKKAGAHRYLLRMETSNPELFQKIHPKKQRFEQRVACIDYLSSSGWQTGSGVMIGLPGQTYDDLVNDILFLKEHNVDMVGMGPYLPHPDTPLTQHFPYTSGTLLLSLKMIALVRIVLKDVNIAAATALQVLADDGREQAILAGANVIMPNLGGEEFKRNYNLYEGKKDLNDNDDSGMSRLLERLKQLGQKPVWDEYGDPRHFFSRSHP